MLIKYRKWLILLATGMMVMLANLDMTIVNLALAKISSALHATMNQSQWIITSYLMATVLFFTIFGKLADIFGRKKIFLVGVFLFTLGSLSCGFSTSIPTLLVSRFIQGLGFAATLGLSFVIIFSNFPPEQKGLAAGLGVGISGVSQAIGPTVGGIIVQHFSWEWVFWLNVPLGIISFFFTSYVTPGDKPVEEKQSISMINASLFVLGLGIIFYAVNQLNQLRIGSLMLYFIVGFVSVAFFVYSAHKRQNPLVNVKLLKHKGFGLLIILRMLFMMIFSSSLFVIPLYLQNILDYSPLGAGLMMLGMTVFVAIASPITGKVIDKIGFAFPVLLSMLLALFAAAMTFFFTADGSLLPLFLALAALGMAIGIHVSSTLAGVNHEVESKDAGTAMGLFFTMALFGSAIGVAVAGNVLESVSRHVLLLHVDSNQITPMLSYAASGARSILTLPQHLQALAARSFMHAYHAFMVLITILMVVAVMIAGYFFRYNAAKSRQLASVIS